MEKITITKEHFLEYLRWQRIGRFNMLDYNSWEPYTGLSRSAWFEIVYHYSDYHKKNSCHENTRIRGLYVHV